MHQWKFHGKRKDLKSFRNYLDVIAWVLGGLLLYEIKKEEDVVYPSLEQRMISRSFQNKSNFKAGTKRFQMIVKVMSGELVE
jgi:hypothetical protein